MELAAYIEANREKLEEAPFGLYAVVPPHAEYQTIKPGAIYCLKQRIEAAGNKPSIRCSRISSSSVTMVRFAKLHQPQAGTRNLPCRESGQDGALRRSLRTLRCPDETWGRHEPIQQPARQGGFSHRHTIRPQERQQPFAGRGGKLVSSQIAIKTTTDFDLVALAGDQE